MKRASVKGMSYSSLVGAVAVNLANQHVLVELGEG